MTSDESFTVHVLRAARDALVAAGIEDGLKAAAFASAVALITREERQEPSRESPAKSGPAPVGSAVDSTIVKISSVLGISVDLAEQGFDVSSGDVRLVVARARLPKAKAPAMRSVALLFAAGRQAGGLEERTLADEIREQCRMYGVLDPNNFATEVAKEGDAFIIHGKGQKKDFRVTRHGFEKAGALLKEIYATE